ncbi:MAG: serine protease [Acidobacteriia bacterium]|nr:serine protease [Terriglobia bacterium]
MKFWRAVFVIILGFTTLGGVAQPQIDNLDSQRLTVVKLRISRVGSSDETATGIYVGKDHQNAYFITAYHAIKPGPSASKVTLQFRNSPQESAAFILSAFDAVLDLGVVRILLADLPPGIPPIPRKDVVSDILVHIIGHPSAGDWSVWPGNVQNENAPNGDVTHFITNRDYSLAGGYSGGPVFDSAGHLLGMHTSTIASYGVALKSLDIVRQLAVWGVPANNITLAPQEGTPAPATGDRVEIVAISPSTDQILPNDQPFALTARVHYRLVSADQWLLVPYLEQFADGDKCTSSNHRTIGMAKPDRVPIKRGDGEVSIQFTVDANQHSDLGDRGYVAPNASAWAGFDNQGRVIVIKEGLWDYKDHCYRLGQ